MTEVLERDGLWAGRRLRFDTLPSTNAWALAHIAELGHGDVVHAVRQTAGRGRFDRVWVTPRDGCLCVSVVLDEQRVAFPAARFAQAAALAVRATLAGFDIAGWLKWPNDVLAGGRKVAGLLAEQGARAGHVVLGIGLNVNMTREELRDPRIGRPATAMSLECGRAVDMERVYARLRVHLERMLELPAAEAARMLARQWAEHDWLAGHEIEAQTPEGVLRGQYLGLSDAGSIRILDRGGREQALWAGDIERVRLPACECDMNMRRFLTEETVCLALKGTTKDEIIAEMIDLMVSARRVPDREAALKCVFERERKMSTGMQHGVAIPHGKTDSVPDVVSALALKKEGVDFASLDGEPSTIFVMTLSPVNRTGPHIQFLAEISRLLSDPLVRRRILAAGSRAEIIEALSFGADAGG